MHNSCGNAVAPHNIPTGHVLRDTHTECPSRMQRVGKALDIVRTPPANVLCKRDRVFQRASHGRDSANIANTVVEKIAPEPCRELPVHPPTSQQRPWWRNRKVQVDWTGHGQGKQGAKRVGKTGRLETPSMPGVTTLLAIPHPKETRCIGWREVSTPGLDPRPLPPSSSTWAARR